jgi:16S rRNA (cytidine1402-2'-O)-methyltransferase
MSGTLYIVATPIGNLEDITIRALGVLGAVDLIACEDTRHTRKLLARYEISKPTLSYHQHNERERAPEIVSRLEAGASVALVSDAGTPLVSDPGYRLVREAIERGIKVVPVPGASAVTAAISASGLPADEVTFAGFLPPRRAARRARLAALAARPSTLVFYEAPHRINETIADARQLLGDRDCVIAREMTKLHEEFIRGPLSEIELSEGASRGEIVLLIGPPRQGPSGGKSEAESESVAEEVDRIMRDEGLDQKGALKRVARSRRISKSEAYRLLLAERAASRLE